MSAPTPLRVRLPFRSEDEFAASYGAHVGRDGFFLATKAPKPVGAQLLFDLILADGTSLMRGEAVVVRSNASGERPGMTLRFVRLEAAGKALVERIISGRPARGSAPAEARAHPSAWAPPAGPSAVPRTPTRESRPAHPDAWAPPGAPGRPAIAMGTPPAVVPAPPAEPDEVSPEEVSEAPSGETADAPTAAAAPAREVTDEASAPDAAGSVVPPGEGPALARPEPEPIASAPEQEVPEPRDLLGSGEARGALPDLAQPELVASASEDEAAAEPGVPPAPELGAADITAPEPGVPPAPEAGAGDITTPGARTGGEGPEGATPVLASSPAPEEATVPPEALTAPSDAGPAPSVAPEPARDAPTEAAAIGPTVPATAGTEPDSLDGLTPVGLGTDTPRPHPPLDDAELPELVVTEFKGPGPLRPAGLEHTPASADVHAAITPPAGTLLATALDEPPPEPAQKLPARRAGARRRAAPSARVVVPRRRAGAAAAALGQRPPDDSHPAPPVDGDRRTPTRCRSLRRRPSTRRPCWRRVRFASSPASTSRGPGPCTGLAAPPSSLVLPVEARQAPPPPAAEATAPRGDGGRRRLPPRSGPHRWARPSSGSRSTPSRFASAGSTTVAPSRWSSTRRRGRPRCRSVWCASPGHLHGCCRPTPPSRRSGSAHRCPSSARAPRPTSPAPSPGAGRRRWSRTIAARRPSPWRAARSGPPSSSRRCSAGCATASRS